ncbi:class I SAM-dependent methyltransferase [Enterococcus sp. CWB-B31]|uniref:class I SAM-dependent methyltransferase n=1 Tax=Enterococcus sp. CWB-B31 TaxID=2885159 RepID=UPI001E3E6CB4|nr:class I SAM-dependent methyltransferase [Enterococcus sp. CWB-B31]MCB5955174.1 class I SAM-dependent methyltransferase [Enterococcus sp. CWB-B31]
MKDFEKENYAAYYTEDIALKLPGYFLMFDLIFKGVLPVEAQKKIDNILLVGGGEIESGMLLKQYPTASYTFVDPSKEMLERVKRSLPKNERLIYKNQAFEEYQTEQCFQLVLSLLVIHFIEDKEAFLYKLYRLLDHKGICIVSAFSNQHLEWWKEYAIKNGANKEEVMRTFLNQEEVMQSVTPRKIEEFASSAGFVKVEKIAQILSIDLWLLKK